ncbi:MAG: inositol-3-phosphate synthase [Candidatus Kariarchaeaceae archaeon]|jgi:myo-inositol-1-phosphate synthase
MAADNIKVAVAGVGNLTSALLQSIYYYAEGHHEELMHPRLAGFAINDIEVVAAFDVDSRKVGQDLSDAIFASPNNKHKVVEIPKTGVIVKMGPVLDGVADYSQEVVEISNEQAVDLVAELKSSGAEMLILNTPSGSQEANQAYVQAALDAGIGLINSTPSAIVRKNEIVRQFASKGLPMIGDDLQSQAGGTIFHKGVLEVLHEQGVKVDDTYQLDVSGGLEGLTTLDYDRRTLKRTTKENSIKRSLPYETNVAAGTTDYLDFLGSRRIGHYWIKGLGFLGHDVKIDIRMVTDDGSNGAASLVDAIRALKVALRRGLSGAVDTVCTHLFKAPPSYQSRTEAMEGFHDFISGERNS